jgi:hypothetical protein
MTTYITDDGEEFLAETHEELVHALRESSRTASASDREYMVEVAERISAQAGIAINTRNATEFVAALIAVGFVKVKSEDD